MSENPPWCKFRVDPKGDSPNDCAELAEVSHVAHLEAAHRIVVDGRIRQDSSSTNPY